MNETQTDLERNLHLVYESYRLYSVIWDATTTRAVQDTDTGLHFEDISISEVVPKDWFDNPAICPEPFFYDMGRNLAIIEENYLLRTVKKNVTGRTLEITEIRRTSLVGIVDEFVQLNNLLPVLFIPADLSAPLYAEPEGVEFTDNREFLQIRPNVRAQLFPTSRYVELRDLVLADKTLGTWIYRLGDHNSLTVEAKRIEDGMLKITAKMQVAYRIDRPTAGHIIHVAGMN